MYLVSIIILVTLILKLWLKHYFVDIKIKQHLDFLNTFADKKFSKVFFLGKKTFYLSW